MNRSDAPSTYPVVDGIISLRAPMVLRYKRLYSSGSSWSRVSAAATAGTEQREIAMRYGYKASAEQFGPRELLDYSRRAEQVGFSTIAVSDHFQPWRHDGGHAPNVLPWLGAIGERTERAQIGTSVLTPTLRYSPAVIAQAFATLGCLNPGRVFSELEPAKP